MICLRLLEITRGGHHREEMIWGEKNIFVIKITHAIISRGWWITWEATNDCKLSFNRTAHVGTLKQQNVRFSYLQKQVI